MFSRAYDLFLFLYTIWIYIYQNVGNENQMKDLVSTINLWQQLKKDFAIARVINTWGSAPRPVGSAMLVSREGEMAGSVSGGCVEGAVLKAAINVMETGQSKSLAYGVSDDEAWTVGLTCGGNIKVFVQQYSLVDSISMEVWNVLVKFISENRSCVLITELSPGENRIAVISSDGPVTGASFPLEIVWQACDALKKRGATTITHNEREYFIHVFPRRSQLLIVGAAHISADLVQLAKGFDFETIVIDPRATFANKTHFTESPDRVIAKYPSEVLGEFELDENTFAVILSHDPKIDDDALRVLLRSKVGYIGALGSRKTNEKRVVRLLELGFSKEEIGRIHAPIGMDIQAQGAKEIALSILGELIKARNAFL